MVYGFSNFCSAPVAIRQYFVRWHDTNIACMIYDLWCTKFCSALALNFIYTINLIFTLINYPEPPDNITDLIHPEYVRVHLRGVARIPPSNPVEGD